MTVAAFLQDLSDKDIRITRKGDRLQLSAAEGVLTDELRAEIGARKAEILAFLEERAAKPESDFVLQRAPRDQKVPLSFAQQRLWFLYQLDPDDPVYNLGISMQLAAPVDEAALTRSLEELAKRHEILRTVFRETDGVPYQVVTDALPALRSVDLTQGTAYVTDADRTAEMIRLREAEVKLPFDLANVPPIRAIVIRHAPDVALLVVVIHHILADGWSFGLLVEQLGELYETFRAGKTTTQVNMPWQYADYAHSEQLWFETSNQQPNVEYWKDKLSGALPSLNLPTDRPHGPVLSSHGAVCPFVLPAELTERLRVLSRKSGVTLSTTLASIFKTLLYRYSNQTDILVGIPVANRRQVELESLIGMFVSTLVLRTDLSQNPTFRELLRRVHSNMLDAHEHQDYPFEKLVDLVRPDRSLAQTALIQTAFILHNTPRVGGREAIGGGAVFELSLHMWDGPSEISGSFEYNTDLFDAETIARMAGHLKVMAEAVVANPDQPISEIPILTETERVQLLETWNRTEEGYPQDRCVHDLFEQQVRTTPDAIAVIASSEQGDGSDGGNRELTTQLTYRELDARANQLAHHLRRLGVGAESFVAIALDRSVDLIVTVLGIWKAGGAYVPLDPSYPRERLAFMVQDAGVTAVVTKGSFLTALPKLDCPIVDLDSAPISSEATSAPEQLSESTSEGALASHRLAYVIYTSGSTGTPKGVMIEHRSVVNFLYTMRREPGLTAADRLLSVTTMSFDIAGLELYLPLTTGACVVLATRAVATDGELLARQLAECKATVMQATPATWRLLLESGWRQGSGLKILCGGEALPRNLADDLLATGATLWNLYGPTETTIWSTRYLVEPTGDPVSIGRPIGNTRLYILDQHQRPVPVNIPGELYIGGDGLARGYHQRPELTVERFVNDPFTPLTGARMYRTGDLVRYRSDGSVEYLGRLDHQVKVRGFRIELGEIESVLLTHAAVEQAVVMSYEAAPGDQRLVAYMIGHSANAGSEPNSADLRAWLSERLPQHLIPTAFVFLNSFPLTPNGKVDRRALLTEQVTPQSTASSTPPRSGLESVVAQVWCETLKVERVWADDNFFDLGGHSLLGIRLLSNLEKVVGHRLPVSVLFQGQTVRAMAAALAQDFSDVSFLAVPLKLGGSNPPLFVVPGIDGDIVGYDRVARELSTGRPVYGLRSVGLDGEASPLNRIEDIAARFIGEIRRVQPQGPYYLSGLCIGGIVAYEIAQQLTAQGDAVDLLVMIGTWPPSTIPDTVSTSRFAQKLAFLQEGVSRHFNAMMKRPRGQRLSYLWEKLGIVSQMVAQRDVYRGDSQTLSRDLVVRANQRAAARYVPAPYPGSAVLIIPDGIPISSDKDPRLLWKSLARRECTTIMVPGHDSGALLKPPAMRGLTDALNDVLNR